jgi:hypothetical protein
MLSDNLAAYLDVAPEEVERLLTLAPHDMYDDPLYQDLLAQLDEVRLRDTLGHARALYDQGLPAIKVKFGWSDTVMSGFTLGNWVLGFLSYPQRLPDLVNYHRRLSGKAIAEALPELAGLLDAMPEGRADWQRALVTLSLPLVAKG